MSCCSALFSQSFSRSDQQVSELVKHRFALGRDERAPLHLSSPTTPDQKWCSPPPPSAPLASVPSSLPGGIITISGAVLLRRRGEEETLGGPEVGEKIEVKDE